MKKKSFEHLLIWSGAFEIFFVGGIFYGWPALQFVLKEENVFAELCANSTASSNTNSKSQISCPEQDNRYNSIFVWGAMLSNCFGMVYGYILDNVGFLPCRLATSIPFSLGLALMPIWPKKTSTIGSIFSGVFDGSAGTILLLKLLYESGIQLKFLFIGLFALTAIQWWRTFFVLPAVRLPNPTPEGYDIRKETVFAKFTAKNSETKSDKKKEELELLDSEATSVEKIDKKRDFFIEIKSLKFILLAYWYCCVSLRINSYQSWFNPSLEWMFKDNKATHSFLTDIFGLTYIMSVPLSPAPGAIVDFIAGRYRRSENNAEKGQRIGIAVNCLLITLSTVVLSYLCTFQNSVSIAITAEVIFSIIRTFLYAVCAQAAFLLFPSHLFGLIYGFLNLLNGLATLLADPIFRIIQGPLEGNYTPVHYILALLVLSTIVQNLHLLRHQTEA